MDHAMSDTARRFISQVLLVFLAMLLIISGSGAALPAWHTVICFWIP